MQAIHPNRLKMLIERDGYTWQEMVEGTGIAKGTLRRWANGQCTIPHKGRVALAQFFGCDVVDFAPLDEIRLKKEHTAVNAMDGAHESEHDIQTGWDDEERVIVGSMYGKEIDTHAHSIDALASQNARHLMDMASVDCFAVDDLITITQSSAFRGWNRDEIFLTKLSEALPVPEDIEALRQEKLPRIQKNYINSSHYRLAAFTPAFSDRRGLEVTLAPIGFYDFYTLIPFLDDLALPGGVSIREKYGAMAFTYALGNTCPIPAPVALHCVVVTKDRQVVLMQRSNSVAFYPNHWSASLEETMDSPGMSPKGNTRPGDADFFACAIRGMEEELGVTTDAIDTIKVLSLNVEYLILAIAAVAVIRTHLTAQELKSHWLLQAPDRNEASKFETVSVEPKAIIQKLFSNNVLWHPTARMRLIQFLFHEYGPKEITAMIAQQGG